MSPELDDACHVRVVSIYSTPWRYLGSTRKGLSDKLALGGLERRYELYKDQLPRLLPLDLLGGSTGEDDIQLAMPVAGIEMFETDAMLFALPSDQIVLAVSLAFTTRPLLGISDVEPIVGVLDQSIAAEIRIRDKNLSEYVEDLAHSDIYWDGLSVRALEGPVGSGRTVVLVAVPKSLAVYAMLAGLSLMGLWSWYRVRWYQI